MINPATLSFATTLMQLILQDMVPLARQLVAIVHKPDPTLADWNALLDSAEKVVDSTLADLAAKGVTPTV